MNTKVWHTQHLGAQPLSAFTFFLPSFYTCVSKAGPMPPSWQGSPFPTRGSELLLGPEQGEVNVTWRREQGPEPELRRSQWSGGHLVTLEGISSLCKVPPAASWGCFWLVTLVIKSQGERSWKPAEDRRPGPVIFANPNFLSIQTEGESVALLYFL